MITRSKISKIAQINSKTSKTAPTAPTAPAAAHKTSNYDQAKTARYKAAIESLQTCVEAMRSTKADAHKTSNYDQAKTARYKAAFESLQTCVEAMRSAKASNGPSFEAEAEAEVLYAAQCKLLIAHFKPLHAPGSRTQLLYTLMGHELIGNYLSANYPTTVDYLSKQTLSNIHVIAGVIDSILLAVGEYTADESLFTQSNKAVRAMLQIIIVSSSAQHLRRAL